MFTEMIESHQGDLIKTNLKSTSCLSFSPKGSKASGVLGTICEPCQKMRRNNIIQDL